MPTKKTSRCWPGYEPVPGKKEHEEGSCRKKAPSKSTPAEKDFQAKREHQLDQWQEQHKGARRSAAQHLHAPATAATAKKKAPVKAANKQPRAPKKRS